MGFAKARGECRVNGVVLGLLAAALQVAGYLIYIRSFLRQSIRPNAASYFMFAYGTAFVTFLAWENGATSRELALPMACTSMSFIVAGICLRDNMTERVDRFEAGVFVSDLLLTIAFGVLVLSGIDKAHFAVAFLLLGNVTTLTAFLPILRSTWRSPSRELPLPWMVWTSAYFVLFLATIVETGTAKPALLVYPLLNLGLHLAMVLLSIRRVPSNSFFRDGNRAVYHDSSQIAGLGVFAGKPFAAGETIWVLAGAVHQTSIPHENPDFVGLGPRLWIDPARPLDKLNHSCNPNAAFGRKRELLALRDVAQGEEITFDYSTTEVDPEWTMACSCRAVGCRLGLHAIHISFADHAEPPPASPLMQLVWRKRRAVAAVAPAFPQLEVAEPSNAPALAGLGNKPAVSRWRRRTGSLNRQRVSPPVPSERVN